MFRKVFTFGGVLALAAALVFATTGPVQAQRHGGGGGFHGGGGGFHGGGGGFHGGGGGFHGGGFHGGGGGFHGGGFRGGYGGFRGGYGGFRGGYGGYRGGYWGGYGGYGGYYGYPYLYGGLYNNYTPYYGSYPDYGSYGYYPSADYDVPDYGGGDTVVPDTSGYYGNVTPPDAGTYPSADSAASSVVTPSTPAAPAASGARITVKAPADATLWFSGYKTTETGSVRTFSTPPLAPGRYTYQVRATWQEGGRSVTQEKQVFLSPGANLELEFPVRQASQAQPVASQER